MRIAGLGLTHWTYYDMDANIILKEVRHATTSQAGCPPASPELAMAGRRREPLHHVIIRGIERKEIGKKMITTGRILLVVWGTIALERRILQSWTAIDIVVIQY